MLGFVSGMSAEEPIGLKATLLLLPLVHEILAEKFGWSLKILVQLEAPVRALLLLSRLQTNLPICSICTFSRSQALNGRQTRQIFFAFHILFCCNVVFFSPNKV